MSRDPVKLIIIYTIVGEMSRSPDVGKRNEQDRETNRKSESPVKMLEDLFRKTKASPYIYWLPLTEEQALEKEKLREAIEKDKLARIAARRESGSKRENSPPSRPALAHQNFVSFYTTLFISVLIQRICMTYSLFFAITSS